MKNPKMLYNSLLYIQRNIPPKLQFRVITDLLVQSNLIVDTGDANTFVLCSVFLVLSNTVPPSYQTIAKMQNITLRK